MEIVKFRKKALVQELVQYVKGMDPLPPQVLVTSAGNAYVWSETSKTEIGIKDGDWINVTNPQDIYPIASEELDSKYDRVEGEG